MNPIQRQPSELYSQQPYVTVPAQQTEEYLSQDYESRNVMQEYGSIIKELTDTEKIVKDFELRLRGKRIDEEGKIVKLDDTESYIKSDRAARDFIDIIRSLVNRHNDFSYYEENDAYAIIQGANYTITRWLMLQGDEVPLRYRFKISFEAMSLISASMHKAMKGRMLVWTKGSFKEGMNHSDNNQQQQGKGFMEMMWPFPRRK